MRKYPCSQCKYQATTQKSLKTHVPTFHNHPPWLTDIVTVIVWADWPFQPFQNTMKFIYLVTGGTMSKNSLKTCKAGDKIVI